MSASTGHGIAGPSRQTSPSSLSRDDPAATPAPRKPPMTLEDVVAFVGAHRAGGQTVVFTNGVFDLLHVGHLRYLQHARGLGDALIVGLNSDRSGRQIKGPERPVHAE